MKKYLFFTIFLFITHFSYSQGILKNDSLPDKEFVYYNCIDSLNIQKIEYENNFLKWIFKDDYVDYIEEKYFRNKKPTIVFNNDVVINAEDIINANVILINGSLKLDGRINGAIASLNSSLLIEKGSFVENNIFLFNSSLKADSLFDFKKISCESARDITERDNTGFLKSYKNHFRIKNDDFTGNGLIRYNRVEGLYIGLKSDRKYHWNGRKNYSFSGGFGYAFGNHRWTGNAEYYLWFGNENRIEFGSELHSIIDSKDNWIIDDIENSLSSFFIHEDFKDHFLKEGGSVYLSQYLNKNTVFRISYNQENYRSQNVNTDWALFGGKKRFRNNPEVTNGILKTLMLGASYNSVERYSYMPNGWDIELHFEKTNGVESFNRVVFDVKRYELFNNGHHLSGRVRFGSSNNILPEQKSFDIGGLGTIPGIAFKSLSGNRLLLFNIDYSFPIFELFDDFFDEEYKYNDRINVIFSYDAGYLYNSTSKDYFKDFNFEKNYTRQDFGISIGLNRNLIRIGAAFRLDKSEPAKFVFRISRPF